MNDEDRGYSPRDPRGARTDLVLMPRQYAYIQRTTEGGLAVYVGPFRASLSETECLIVTDEKTGKPRVARDQTEAIRDYINVSEGEYVILTNPPTNGIGEQPKPKTNNDIVELSMGRQVNIPGPVSFALWPFQTVRSLKGHQLQMNQYLIVRVINEEEASKNWDKAIIKPQASEGGQPASKHKPSSRPENLSVGQLILIKGTEVSFYIPPTGLEVVKDSAGEYIREAVTLEQLEYCVLTDQNGERRIEKGPQVVFPKPSETFTEIEGDNGRKFRKFKAIELTKISGIHVKVTAPYKEDEKTHEAGDELFITGADQPIYFPRTEHAIIRYDGREVHFATAVPKGEGRYVLDRFNGIIRSAVGPEMLLLDPRTEVFARRILTEKQVRLWYPCNMDALRINMELASQAQKSGLSNDYLADMSEGEEVPTSRRRSFSGDRSLARFAGDEMERKSTYTPPRTVTLGGKYDGAVGVDVWTGYAVLIVDRSGNRRVVEGPKTVLLEFDESLATMQLSTGKPKTTDNLLETAYLSTNNLVSDMISVETSDSVGAQVKVSYRVKFTGPKEKWFDVENYVKVLCDHARSIIRNMVRKVGIQKFSSDYIDMIRDTILGKPEGAEGEKKARKGMLFEENGMQIFDVEVLSLSIGDGEISELLVDAQHQAVKNALEIDENKRLLEAKQETERIARETAQIENMTAIAKLEGTFKLNETSLRLQTQLAEMESVSSLMKVKLQKDELEANVELTKLKIGAETAVETAKLELAHGKNAVADYEHQANLARNQADWEQRLSIKKEEIALEIEMLMANSKELAERTKAVTPELIAALQTFGDKALVEKMASAMAPMALLGGNSVAEVLSNLLKGSGLDGLIPAAAKKLAGSSN